MAELKESIELSVPLDTLDLSSYQSIYISYGSKNNETPPYEFYHDFPFFMKFAKLPMICITIDMYQKFTQTDRPFETMPDDIKATCTYVTVPSFTMADSFSITEKLLEKLKLNTSARVFFVNFIKYKHPNEEEKRNAIESMKLKQIVAPYDYYDWCGYRLPHFIIKNSEPTNQVFTNVQKYLDILFTLVTPTDRDEFISSFSNGENLKQVLKKKHHKRSVADRIQIYKELRSCLFDITSDIMYCTPQLKILLNIPEDWEEEYPENEFGGKRTKQTKKRTKKRNKRTKYL